MKKYIVKTVIVFSVSIITFINLTLSSNKVSTNGIKLNNLFSQAFAACENSKDAYTKSSSTQCWFSALPFYESYVKESWTKSYESGSGCVITQTYSFSDCSKTFDITSFCNPTNYNSVSCK